MPRHAPTTKAAAFSEMPVAAARQRKLSTPLGLESRLTPRYISPAAETSTYPVVEATESDSLCSPCSETWEPRLCVPCGRNHHQCGPILDHLRQTTTQHCKWGKSIPLQLAPVHLKRIHRLRRWVRLPTDKYVHLTV